MLTILAHDYSGSTSGFHAYHALVARIAETLDPNNTRVLLWDSTCRQTDLRELARVTHCREGRGGTAPSTIVPFLDGINQPYRLLFFSDGEVCDSSVAMTDHALQGISKKFLQYVEIHLVGSNRSVSCPFTRYCPHKVYVYDRCTGKQVIDECVEVTAEDLDMLNRVADLKTVEEVEAELPVLERAVFSRVMGRQGDVELANALVAMKRRVIADLARKQGRKSEVQAFVDAVRERGETALPEMQRVIDLYYSPEVVSLNIQQRCDRLISAAEGALQRVFSEKGIRSIRLERAPEVKDVEMENLPDASDDAMYPCPLTMDMENDMILLVKDNLKILDAFPSSMVDACMQCPLAALRFPEVVKAIQDSLDDVMSLRFYRDSYETTGSFMTTSPYTRSPVLVGGITMGCHEDHASATDWTLSRLLFGTNKMLGNKDLWYAVLYFCLPNRFAGSEVQTRMLTHLKWRMRNHTSYASFTGLANFVSTRLPLDACAYFVLCSPAAKIPVNHLNGHAFHAEWLIRLCEIAGVQLLPGVETHVERTKLFLQFAKTKPDLRGLYQNAYFSTAGVVYLDGPASIEQVHMLRMKVGSSLPSNELYALAHTTKELTFDFQAPPLPEPLVEWKYSLTMNDDFEVTIHPHTMRPIMGENGWRDSAKARFGVEDIDHDALRAHKYYVDYVCSRGVTPPNRDAFLVYVYDRETNREVGKHSTLPNTEQVLSVYDDYARLTRGIPVSEIKRRMDDSRQVDERRRIEIRSSHTI